MTVKHILLGLFLLSNWYTVFTINYPKGELELNLVIIWNVFSIISCLFQSVIGVIALFVLINESKTWEKINDWLNEPITFKKRK